MHYNIEVCNLKKFSFAVWQFIDNKITELTPWILWSWLGCQLLLQSPEWNLQEERTELALFGTPTTSSDDPRNAQSLCETPGRKWDSALVRLYWAGNNLWHLERKIIFNWNERCFRLWFFTCNEIFKIYTVYIDTFLISEQFHYDINLLYYIKFIYWIYRYYPVILTVSS